MHIFTNFLGVAGIALRRDEPMAVVERRMLNANEDNLESLKAPTTKLHQLSGIDKMANRGPSGAAPAPADAMNVPDTQTAWNNRPGHGAPKYSKFVWGDKFV